MKCAITIIAVLSATGFLVAAGAYVPVSFNAQEIGDEIAKRVLAFTSKTEVASREQMDESDDCTDENIVRSGKLAYASKLISSVGKIREATVFKALRELRGKDYLREIQSIIESQNMADSLVDDKLEKLMRLADTFGSNTIYADVKEIVIDMKKHTEYLANLLKNVPQ